MTPQELKNSIFKLALQGKLVKQIEFEGTGEELYDSMTFLEKKILDPILESEIPFDIPSSWKWVRHNELFEIIGGSQPPKDKFKSEPFNGGVRLYQIRDYGDSPVPIYVKKELASKFTKEGDILLARYGGSIGKVFWAKDGAYNVAMAKVVPLFKGECLDKSFCYYYYLGPLYQYLVRNNSRSAQAGFNKEDLNSLLFPLPPLAEQIRIVAKIEELLPLVDRYEEAWNKLEDFNNKFPADMEKSLLVYAISGKLTSQFESDGDAKDIILKTSEKRNYLYKNGLIKKSKQFPEITNDEIPFEIPPTWVWCRVSDVCYQIYAGGDKPSDFTQTKDEKRTVPVVANGITNDGIMGYTRVATAKRNTITVAGRGTIGFSVFRNYDYCPIVRLIVLEQSDYVNPKYLQFALNALPETGLGTSIPQLTVPMLAPKLIPLPPLEEQNRIVAKLEELLPLCRKLVK